MSHYPILYLGVQIRPRQVQIITTLLPPQLLTSMTGVPSYTVFILRCIAKASPGTDCHHVVTSSDSGEMFLWDTVDGLCQESLSTLLLATKQLKVLNVCLSETF